MSAELITASLPRIVVLISGSGSNLQALIDAIQNGSIMGQIVAVISNRSDALGLERARIAGIEGCILEHHIYKDRSYFDQLLQELVDAFAPHLVVLAGFMRILTPAFVNHFHGRLLNIHPSLLPDFRGLHTHERALDAKVSWHGCSVHFVTEELDGGPVIMQARVPVLADDSPASLAARVLQKEHCIYPEVVKLFCQKRLSLGADGILFDGEIIAHPLLWQDENT